jgi:FkbM family methyltransferase
VSLLHRTRTALHKAGLDVQRYPTDQPGHVRALALANHAVDLVIDVGANRGQYGAELRAFGYRGRIDSFEPQSEQFGHLAERAIRDDRWSVTQCALGPEPGSVTLNLAANSGASSSVLPMLDSHRTAAPHARYVATEQVEQLCLDDAAADSLAVSQRPFLKVDVQGYERHVLDGGRRALDRAVGIEMELSFVPLYDGGMLWTEALTLLEELNLALHTIFPGLTDPKSGRLLQADGLFFRV